MDKCSCGNEGVWRRLITDTDAQTDDFGIQRDLCNACFEKLPIPERNGWMSTLSWQSLGIAPSTMQRPPLTGLEQKITLPNGEIFRIVAHLGETLDVEITPEILKILEAASEQMKIRNQEP